MSMLDPLLPGNREVWANGVKISPTREGINIIGTGLTAVDNPDTLLTDITLPAADGSVTPLVDGPLLSTSATPITVRTIPLADNSMTFIESRLVARDTGNNWLRVTSVTTWTRSAGGIVIQSGIDDGPPAVVTPASFTGALFTPTASGNNVLMIYTPPAIHTRYEMTTWVTVLGLAAAT